jgi:hypothetical protein
MLAAQKVRLKTDPTPEELPKLTAEQRKAIYAPKPVAPIIATRPPMPVRILKTTGKALAVFVAMFIGVVVTLLVGESKRGFWS